jgi:hypothetical protein
VTTMDNFRFLYHVANDGDVKLFLGFWIALYCVIHIIWEIVKTGRFSPASWTDKGRVVAGGMTLATGLLLFQCYFFSDVFKLVGEAGLAETLVISAFVNVFSGLKEIEPV